MNRRWLCTVLSIVALSVVAAPAARAASHRLRPQGKPEAVRVRVGGKLRLYHVTRSATPLAFKLKGPVAVRVLCRYLFEAAAGEVPAAPVSYRVRLEIDGVELRTLALTADPSTRLTATDGRPLSSLRKEVVQIPEGRHTVHLIPEPETAAVAVRLFRGSGRPRHVKWVPFAPETYLMPVRLQGRDTEVIYYRFSADQPVTFSINGPLSVRLMTRLDFGLERGYSQSYAIQTYLDGELLQSSVLKARASHTSSYPELPEITPGVGRDVTFEVPAGRHQILITLAGTTEHAAALRILIPESAVTNGS